MSTIDATLVEAAQLGGGELVFHLQDEQSRLSLEELVERASGAAALLVARGIRPGDAVGLLGPNRPEWAVWAFGVWMAGGVLVALPFPLIVRDSRALADQLSSLIRVARCRLVVGDPLMLPAASAHECLAWDQPVPVRGPLPGGVSDAERTAVIQFSSGSTSSPKGAVLSHRAVLAEMSMLEARLGNNADRMVGWAPFFHDLGLFLHLVYPALSGRSVGFLPTERFARNPLLWFQLLTSTEATLTIGPASAFSITARLASRRPQGIDLRALRVAWFAAELVDPELADEVLSAAHVLRLDPGSMGNGYGLAECVLGVSTTVPGRGLTFDHVDLEQLGKGGTAVAASVAGSRPRRVASCGLPLAGCEIRVAGPQGVVAERRVGEVQVRGPSTMARFVGAEGTAPFVDGWLRTGDLGYLSHGELYVTGRSKDMVIVMGQNFYPEDFEWAADRADGVRRGRCVAFSRPGSERVVVLVEASVNAVGEEVRNSVARTINETLGVFGYEVVLVPRGSVLRTTSGKVRRSAMREAYLRGEVPPLSLTAPLA